MMKKTLELFKAFCAIPHTSGNEAALRDFICTLARDAGLQTLCDKAGNVLVRRPASPGFEDKKCIILQGHLDMVGEKDADEDFNFLSDGIIPVEEDGFLRSSRRTTLGADDGIGVAAAMALLLDRDFQCGELHGLFTVSEETALVGAANLDASFLSCGAVLYNLDSEDEGVFTVGCAGGVRSSSSITPERMKTPADWRAVELTLAGLPGGHSGVDIGKNIPNAVLQALGEVKFSISSLSGGGLDNAIPRSMTICGAAPEGTDIGKGVFTGRELPETVLTEEFQTAFLSAFSAMPDGALRRDECGNVTASSNLASVRTDENGTFRFVSSQRGNCNEWRDEARDAVAAAMASAGGTTESGREYPAWPGDMDSPLPKKLSVAYKELFGTQPAVEVIHAGLECGFFAGKCPGLQMISFGPTVLNPHSPSERLDLKSLERFIRFLRHAVSCGIA